MSLVLDTSAYIGLRRGHPGVLDAIAEAKKVLIPTTVLGELEAGFELSKRAAENRAVLKNFLAESFVAVRPVDHAVARRYGRVFAALRRAGTPIPLNDVWIAAISLIANAPLLTLDRHFDKVSDLEVWRLDS